MDKELLKFHIMKQRMNSADVAAKLGINESTYFRKLNGTSDFTRNEIMIIKDVLGLTVDDVDRIFF